jgi:hypothetical protein
MLRRTTLLALAWLPCAGTAQTVYRCGAEGRSYSHTPCHDGRALDVRDARSPAERAQGAAAAERTARLADSMERDRLMAEAALRPPTVISIGGRPSGPADSQPASRDTLSRRQGFKVRAKPGKTSAAKGSDRARPSRTARRAP